MSPLETDNHDKSAGANGALLPPPARSRPQVHFSSGLNPF